MLIQHRTCPRPTANPVMPKPNLEIKMDVLCFTKHHNFQPEVSSYIHSLGQHLKGKKGKKTQKKNKQKPDRI